MDKVKITFTFHYYANLQMTCRQQAFIQPSQCISFALFISVPTTVISNQSPSDRLANRQTNMCSRVFYCYDIIVLIASHRSSPDARHCHVAKELLITVVALFSGSHSGFLTLCLSVFIIVLMFNVFHMCSSS